MLELAGRTENAAEGSVSAFKEGVEKSAAVPVASPRARAAMQCWRQNSIRCILALMRVYLQINTLHWVFENKWGNGILTAMLATYHSEENSSIPERSDLNTTFSIFACISAECFETSWARNAAPESSSSCGTSDKHVQLHMGHIMFKTVRPDLFQQSYTLKASVGS